jgi:hypothetical protein
VTATEPPSWPLPLTLYVEGLTGHFQVQIYSAFELKSFHTESLATLYLFRGLYLSLIWYLSKSTLDHPLIFSQRGKYLAVAILLLFLI